MKRPACCQPLIGQDKTKGPSKVNADISGTATVVVDENQQKNINMGRADDNDLVVKGNLISRIHARVEMRRGKFMLIDQSTNGTFLENALPVRRRFVRRDSSELNGEGIIGLGRVAKPGTPLAIHFICEE